MEKILKNKVLHDLYEKRRDVFESLVCKENTKTYYIEKTGQELEEIIKKIVKNDQEQENILLKLDEYHDALVDEMAYWNEQYYKFGFIDNIILQGEINEGIEKLKDKAKIIK